MNVVAPGLIDMRAFVGEPGAEHRDPEVAAEMRDRRAEIGAEHEQRAVREIDDARHAEDQRQARGDQEQRRRAREAVQELDQDRGRSHKKRGSPPFFGTRRKAQSLRIARTSANDGRKRSPAAKRQLTITPWPFFFASCPT